MGNVKENEVLHKGFSQIWYGGSSLENEESSLWKDFGTIFPLTTASLTRGAWSVTVMGSLGGT